jgi:hypothetical protein
MSNKTILIAAARQAGREKQAQKMPIIQYDYMPVFPNCRFWEHHNPVRYVNRIPMEISSTIKLFLGCPYSSIPTYVENNDPLEPLICRFDFKALNNCKGSDCEWFNTVEKD